MSSAESGVLATFAASSPLCSVTYGINATLSFMIVRRLWKQMEGSEERTRFRLMAIYVFTIFTLATIHVVTGNVVEGNFLAQLVNAELDKPIPENPYVADGMNAVVYVLLTVLTDGLLVSEAPFSFSSFTTIFFAYLVLALFGPVRRLYRNVPLDIMDPSSRPLPRTNK